MVLLPTSVWMWLLLILSRPFCEQVEKMKEIAKQKEKEERRKLESEVSLEDMYFSS